MWWIARSLLAVVAALAFVGALPTSSPAGDQAHNPLAGAKLFVDPDSDAARQVRAWQDSRPADAQVLAKLAGQPTSDWLGGWLPDVGQYVRWYIDAKLRRAGATAFFSVYDLPQRDCSGHYSAGGAASPADYRAWVDRVAAAIGSYPAIVVVEPDGLPDSACLSGSRRAQRVALERYATTTLAALPATAVYIDAGRSDWRSAADMIRLLRAAGVARARGFSLNVTGYATTRHEVRYGHRIGAALGGRHFIVNTSRNGRGPATHRKGASLQSLWCNQRGRGLGLAPTTATADPLADAYEWVLHPGYSDGPCNGGAKAGTWWPDYALELARDATW